MRPRRWRLYRRAGAPYKGRAKHREDLMAAYWPTLGTYAEGLEQAGKLLRITTPINKDTELHPLVRLQFRGLPESERKAFLFENVIDSRGRRYDIPVLVGALAGSAEIYALGMGCRLEDMAGGWREGASHTVWHGG